MTDEQLEKANELKRKIDYADTLISCFNHLSKNECPAIAKKAFMKRNYCIVGKENVWGHYVPLSFPQEVQEKILKVLLDYYGKLCKELKEL